MLESIRGRLLVSSALWTIGLVLATNFFFLSIVTHRIPGAVLHFLLMSTAGLALLGAAAMQVRSILALFKKLQSQLAAIRGGGSERVEGRYPREIEPLVT